MIITLSRQLGSEGDAIAARVVSTLGLTLVDREYVYRAALAAGVPDSLLQQMMYEGQRSLAAEIMDSLAGRRGRMKARSKQAPPPLLGVFAPLMPPASLQPGGCRPGSRAVDQAKLPIKETCLSWGRAAKHCCAAYAGAFHVQVVAPLDLRVSRLVQWEKLTPAEARRRVRSNDQARADYLARYHDIRWLDPLLYDLVINTGQMSVDDGRFADRACCADDRRATEDALP